MTTTQRYWLGNLAMLAGVFLLQEPLLVFAMMVYTAWTLSIFNN